MGAEGILGGKILKKGRIFQSHKMKKRNEKFIYIIQKD